MLNENHITELLASYFIEAGCEIVNKLTTILKGIDPVVKDKHGISTYIEIKGETSARITSKRYGKPFNISQTINHIGKVLVATFKAMNNYTSENERFAIAFPDTIGHEAVLDNIK